jgi:hypothetical protein
MLSPWMGWRHHAGPPLPTIEAQTDERGNDVQIDEADRRKAAGGCRAGETPVGPILEPAFDHCVMRLFRSAFTRLSLQNVQPEP